MSVACRGTDAITAERVALVGRNDDGRDVFVRAADGARMIALPGGAFSMGGAITSNPAVQFPRTSVRVETFLIDEAEVSVGRFREVFPRRPWRPHPRHLRSASEDLPATGVTWALAEAYCEHVGARLPTEAEWEYAAAGPEGRRFVWGDEWPPPPRTANLADESARDALPKASPVHFDGIPGLAVIRALEADRSWAGVRDLGGNASEWTLPVHLPDTPGGIARRADAPEDGTTMRRRVLRGGNFKTADEGWAAAAARTVTISDEERRLSDAAWLGFRCAMDAPAD